MDLDYRIRTAPIFRVSKVVTAPSQSGQWARIFSPSISGFIVSGPHVARMKKAPSRRSHKTR
jgi:hypothetical protein